MKSKVHAESKNQTKVEVNVRGYSFEIDEPEAEGGTGSAPNPVEYELGALTGCLNVVAHLVAKEKGVELESLEIDASGELNPAKFQGKETDERAGFQEIELNIKAEADTDDETLREIFEEAEKRCPVRDNINHETPVELNINT
ncbi:OsmC family protein [Candidatus Nanohalobium constans]|uniref:OsmC family peroxiredoxin n=1 Tax=Candidatus Nanohalobium constans TaxID=2565781 RepID=A0A5Q0UHM3_9ARCH|nr:OsmC family protein [Candidatus Nanohalobium constans]QGA80700.1 OsmC family peroxiredoxin [Candidatus Nanohalobium constans]